MADLSLTPLELIEHTASQFSLICHPGLPGFSWVMMGILRAMADDYGALVMLDHVGHGGDADRIEITLVETAFAEGRHFELGARAEAEG